MATSHKGSVENLMDYWAAGPGLAKWATSPTPFRTLRALLSKYVPANMLDGLTANLYHRVFNRWPGQDEKGGGKAPSSVRLASRLKR